MSWVDRKGCKSWWEGLTGNKGTSRPSPGFPQVFKLQKAQLGWGTIHRGRTRSEKLDRATYRLKLNQGIETGRVGIFLMLTEEQYAKLRRSE